MKTHKLTTKIINSLRPESYLYAEIASGGAMGDAGSARLYTLTDDGELKYYYASLYHDDPEETAGYEALYKKLSELEKDEYIVHQYANFGNDAYKGADLEFFRDDDHYAFLYEVGEKTFKLQASCPGVYGYIAHLFTRRKLDLDLLKSLIDHHRPAAERAFLRNYLDYCRKSDTGQSWLDFSVEDFQNAIELIEYRNHRTFNLPYYTIGDDLLALEKYHLKYVKNLIGWNDLEDVLADFLKDDKNLFEKISQRAGVDITKKFKDLEKLDSGYVPIHYRELDNLESLCKYPCLINFTPSAHQKIQQEILKSDPSALRANAISIAYYLANYLNNDDHLPYSDVLPVVVHIIKNLPADDWNNTCVDHLFWLASEVINRAWISCPSELDDAFDRFLYDLYWPRVGGLWPIEHHEEFDFKEPSAAKIFDESLGFILSLDHLEKYNPELKNWLKSTNSEIKAKFAIPPAYSVDTKAETLEILGNIFQGEDLPSYEQLSTFESFLLHNNYPETRKALLTYLDDHFDHLKSLFEKLETPGFLTSPESDETPNAYDTFASFFTAACVGARFDFERELLENLAKRFATLPLKAEKENLTPALAHADHLISAYSFQSSHLKSLLPLDITSSVAS